MSTRPLPEPQSDTRNLQTLQLLMLPVLARASIGDFSGIIKIEDGTDPQSNEMLMGVNLLLEEIRAKAHELEVAHAQLQRTQDTPANVLDGHPRRSVHPQ